jgi:FkbM family methyltransferase
MSLYLYSSNGVMIDVGANIGTSTLPLAAKHPQVSFHCYEPHPEIFTRQKKYQAEQL